LPGQRSEATKIWANGGEKYAWFRAIPVVNPESVCEKDIHIGRDVSVTSYKINGECANEVTVNQGESLDIHLEYFNPEEGCTNCLEQILVGIQGRELDCIYHGNPTGHMTDDYQLSLDDLEPGTYTIVAAATFEYSCLSLTDGTPIAVVHVLAPEPKAAIVETIQFTTSGPGESCDNACEAIVGECIEEKLVLQSAEEVASWALAVGVTCTEIVDRCDIGESPIFNYSIWEREGLCTFCSKPSHPGWLSGNRCRAKYQVRERICPCAAKIQIEKGELAQNCDDTCAAVGEQCIESKLVLQSVEEVESWANAVGVTCSEIVDRCDMGESPIFNYSIWERKGLCTYCSKTSHPGWLNGKRCRARWHTRERMCPCTSTPLETLQQ